ncbi:Hypp1289 [Branchiostoma lanceolatum]|uniref:Hypp1289 protein n=1 Tax=Branchiostoma lanceolatum TaxID=7740 RepID=A0A8J9ZHZ1_BRALA|nr:Hypp1289 [Branchiostoma lanceolatum]
MTLSMLLVLLCALSSVTQGQTIAEEKSCRSNRDCSSTQCCRVNGYPLAGIYPIMEGATTPLGTCGPRIQDGEVCGLMYVSGDSCACEDGLRCWGGITGIQPISGTCRTPEYIQQQYDDNPFWFLIP